MPKRKLFRKSGTVLLKLKTHSPNNLFMQNYLTQFLHDLKGAQNNKPVKPNYKVLYPDHPANDPEYEGHLDYIMEWEMGPQYDADDLFGISVDAFPPAERLTESQQQSLVEAILELWQAFNIVADYPDEVPVTALYNALVNRWKGEPFQYISEGTLHLEFCHYEPEECPWGLEYCTCKELHAKWENGDPYKMTPEEEAHWEKGLQPGGGWINPDLLDDDGNFDPNKLLSLDEDDNPNSLPF